MVSVLKEALLVNLTSKPFYSTFRQKTADWLLTVHHFLLMCYRSDLITRITVSTASRWGRKEGGGGVGGGGGGVLQPCKRVCVSGREFPDTQADVMRRWRDAGETPIHRAGV